MTQSPTTREGASAQQAAPAGDAIQETPMTTFQMTWEGDRAPFAKAFVEAQKATEAVKKAASNPHFKSKYADLSEVVEATVPALNKAGIGVIQSPGFDGDLVHISTTFLHESGASVTGVLSLRPSKTDAQGVGSAITYGRRYSLLAMTGAAPEDDDGNAASGPQSRSAPAPSPGPVITQDQADELQALAEDVGADMPKFLSYLRASSLATIPASRFQDAIAALEAKRQKAAA